MSSSSPTIPSIRRSTMVDTPQSFHLTPEKLGDEVVTLLVGPEEQKFTVHKKLICERSSYFRGAFMTGFSEAQTNIMHFPEGDPSKFTVLVDYLYRGLVVSAIEVGEEWYYGKMMGTYVLAEKLCMNDLMNKLMDSIIGFFRGRPGYIGRYAPCIYPNTHANSPLRAFISFEMAAAICVKPSACTTDPKLVEKIKATVDEYIGYISPIPELSAEVFRHIAKFSGDGLKMNELLREDLPSCTFHHHGPGEICHHHAALARIGGI